MKILPKEVYSSPQLPDIETAIDAVEQLGVAAVKTKALLEKNSTQLIYDEDRFKEFLAYAQEQQLTDSANIQTALKDLEKETPQALLNLFIKTEVIATPAGVIVGGLEVATGQGGVATFYATASIIRALVSYKLSKNIVDHRLTLALGEMVPHAGRFTVFVMLAEEHPELTRLLWAYFKCRKSLKNSPEDKEKIKNKFYQATHSNVLEFIIGPKEFTEDAILNVQANSTVIRTIINVGRAIGLK